MSVSRSNGEGEEADSLGWAPVTWKASRCLPLVTWRNRPMNRKASRVSLRETNDPYLASLLVDYEAARSDDRSWSQLLGGLFAVLVTLIGLLVSNLPDVASFGCAKGTTNCATGNFLLAVLPLAPAAVLAFVALVGVPAALRSYYLRSLEKAIREQIGDPEMPDVYGQPVPAVSWIELQVEVTSFRRGEPLYRGLAMLMVVAVAFIYLGLIVVIFLEVDPVMQSCVLTFYSAVTMFLIAMGVKGTVGGLDTFENATQRMQESREETKRTGKLPARPEKQLHFARYLMFPRPVDFVKWAFVPLTTLIFLLSYTPAAPWIPTSIVGSPPTSWAHRALVIVVATGIFEGLIYSARYQWNDIRDYKRDVEHPAAQARGRLPYSTSPPEQRTIIGVSLFVLAYRLVLSVGLTAVLAPDLLIWALMAIGLVFATALIYELLKDKSRRVVADRRAASKRPTIAVSDLWAKVNAGIWIWVGAGYVIRGVVAWRIASYLGVPVDARHLTAALICLGALGVFSVAQTWALEADSFLLGKPMPGEQECWPSAVDRAAVDKPHVASLLRFTPHVLTAEADRNQALQQRFDVVTPEPIDHKDAAGLARIRSAPIQVTDPLLRARRLAAPAPAPQAAPVDQQADEQQQSDKWSYLARTKALARRSHWAAPWHPALLIAGAAALAYMLGPRPAWAGHANTQQAIAAAGLVAAAMVFSIVVNATISRVLMALLASAGLVAITLAADMPWAVAVSAVTVLFVDASFRISTFFDLVSMGARVVGGLLKGLVWLADKLLGEAMAILNPPPAKANQEP